MVEEARLVQTEHGLVPEGDGWFVVNVRDVPWSGREGLGAASMFESSKRASLHDLGINIRVVEPGQPVCMYHGEGEQEDFLVLTGECTLLIDGQERRVKAWDFVHCPPWAEHVFIGAGSGPCAILMVGTRKPEDAVRYPVSELAARYGASVERETTDPAEAYAAYPRAIRPAPDHPDLPWS
jgi:uncharacterized cupin superfamily protein